jgi:hypothetical protein
MDTIYNSRKMGKIDRIDGISEKYKRNLFHPLETICFLSRILIEDEIN